jgi:hypothetical protein
MFGLVIIPDPSGLSWPTVWIKRTVTTGYGGIFPIGRIYPTGFIGGPHS